MQNVQMKVDGDILVIEVDLSAEGQISASGKTVVIASTRGNKDVPGTSGYKVGLNLFKYPDATR